jgi:ribosomal protein L34E
MARIPDWVQDQNKYMTTRTYFLKRFEEANIDSSTVDFDNTIYDDALTTAQIQGKVEEIIENTENQYVVKTEAYKERVFTPPTCHNCGEPLITVKSTDISTYTFNPKTGKYDQDGYAEERCGNCEEIVAGEDTDPFPDGVCNYQAK